jgi:hypothetical protein
MDASIATTCRPPSTMVRVLDKAFAMRIISPFHMHTQGNRTRAWRYQPTPRTLLSGLQEESGVEGGFLRSTRRFLVEDLNLLRRLGLIKLSSCQHEGFA